MQAWQKFLDSLATKGGNLFVLFVCFGGLLGLLIHVLHHGDAGNVSMVVVATFSGFAGALMATLTGKDSKDTTEHVPGGKTTSTIIASSNSPSSPNASPGIAVTTISESGAPPVSAGTSTNDGSAS